MKFKVKFFDKKIFDQWLYWMGGAVIIRDIVAVFCKFEFSEIMCALGFRPENSFCCRLLIGVAVIFITYCVVFWRANTKKSANIVVGKNNVSVCVGDIFDKKYLGFKVIPVNEYYDTIVDDVIISKNSLHGQYILKHCKNVSVLNDIIRNDSTLQEEKVGENFNRKGNIARYKLGSLVVYDDFILTAMTKFDEKNKARLTRQEYVNFLMHFWQNIDVVYAGKEIKIPILGSGITRFDDGSISKQECLKLILATFKISSFCRTHNNIKLNIIVCKEDIDEIDFYHLEG